MKITKKKTLVPEEFNRLTELLNDPGLLIVKSKYESTGFYVDSWMEWDINIQHADKVQKIEVVNFFRSGLGFAQPYSDSLLQLGCAVWKIRDNVFGDEPGHRDAKCEFDKRCGSGYPTCVGRRVCLRRGGRTG